MKKKYLTPQMEVMEIRKYQPLLAGSYDVNTDIGIEGGSGGDEPAMVPGLDDGGIFGMPSFLFE
jgi:hypothetical protein